MKHTRLTTLLICGLIADAASAQERLPEYLQAEKFTQE